MRLTINVVPLGGTYIPWDPATQDKNNNTRFLEISDGDETIEQLCIRFCKRWSELYPDKGPLNVRKIRDGRGCDLDPAYFVQEVFYDDPSNAIASVVVVYQSPLRSREDSVAPESTLRPRITHEKRLPSPIIETAEDAEYAEFEKRQPERKRRKTAKHRPDEISQLRSEQNELPTPAKPQPQGPEPASTSTIVPLSSLENNTVENMQDDNSLIYRYTAPASQKLKPENVSQPPATPSIEKATVPDTPNKPKDAAVSRESPTLPKSTVSKRNAIPPPILKPLTNGTRKPSPSSDSGSETDDSDASPEQQQTTKHQAAHTLDKGKQKDPQILQQEAAWELANEHVEEQLSADPGHLHTKGKPLITGSKPDADTSATPGKRNGPGRPPVIVSVRGIIRPAAPEGDAGMMVPIAARRIRPTKPQSKYAGEITELLEKQKSSSLRPSELQKIRKKYIQAAARIEKPLEDWTAEEIRAIPLINAWMVQAERAEAERETLTKQFKAGRESGEEVAEAGNGSIATPSAKVSRVSPPPAAESAGEMATQAVSNPSVGLEAQMSVGSSKTPKRVKAVEDSTVTTKKNKASVPTPKLDASDTTRASPTLATSKVTPVPPPQVEKPKGPHPAAAQATPSQHKSSTAQGPKESSTTEVHLSSDEEDNTLQFSQEEIEAHRKKTKARKERAVQGDITVNISPLVPKKKAPADDRSTEVAKREKASKPEKAAKSVKAAKKLEPQGDFELASTRLKKEQKAMKQTVNNTPNTQKSSQVNSTLNLRPTGFIPDNSLYAAGSGSPSQMPATVEKAISAVSEPESEAEEQGEAQIPNGQGEVDEDEVSAQSDSSLSSTSLEDSDSTPDSASESDSDESDLAQDAQEPPVAMSSQPSPSPSPSPAKSRSTPLTALPKAKPASALAGRTRLSDLVAKTKSKPKTPIPVAQHVSPKQKQQPRVVGQVLSQKKEESSSSDDDSDDESDSDSSSDSKSKMEIDTDLHPSRASPKKQATPGRSSFGMKSWFGGTR